jgi:UDP-N-acetylglucosamine--N-acetylmuramyl-(pentapeptide) pyrophosphoryl-undecaprenol N-acetylglucosamine transferase
MKRVILAAGGTGGHVFPAQSVGAALIQRGDQVFYITDHRGSRFFRDEDPPLHVMRIRRIGGILGALRFLYGLAHEVWQCYWILRRLKPDVVMGFGSYASVPPIVAALILRIPTVLHEQNAVLGRANRYLSKFANRVACSFEKTAVASCGNVIWTGNPLRLSFFHSTPYQSLPSSPFNIVVIGGSQGSRIFSEVIPKTIMLLSEAQQANLIIHQHVRPEDADNVRKIYEEFKGQVIIKDFFHNIAELYNQAHLIIARSGASTVSELCTVGRPAILVPYGASLEGDQLYNASYLADRQACIMMREYEFTPRNLKKVLDDLLSDPSLLQKLATNIHHLAIPDAIDRLLFEMDLQSGGVA